MKQWLILIISIAIIIFSGFYECKYLRETSQFLLSDIEYCKNAVENNNFDIAKNHIKEVYNTWDDVSNIWSIFVDHDEIGNIEEELLQFKLYIEEENKSESIVACKELERIILHSVEKQEVSVANVF